MRWVNVMKKNGDILKIEIDDSMITLEDLLKHVYPKNYKDFFGARVNNIIRNLNKNIYDYEDEIIEFIDVTNQDGYRIMMRTVTAVFLKACDKVYPERTMKIAHSLGAGLYTSFENGYSISFKDLPKIKEEMQKIIDRDIKITREKHKIDDAIRFFEERGADDKVKLFKTLKRKQTDIYTIGQYRDTFHGYLAPSTGYIKDFDLKYYYPGIIIQFPTPKSPDKVENYKEQKKLARVFDESNRWAEILGLEYLGSLNETVENGKISEVIRVSEALQEKRLGKIADEICDAEDVNIILIAGPSSSGKTTFANRLAVQLKVNGKRPIIISGDDYFVNREDTPLNEDGSYDFEALEAIDLDKLNEDLILLLEGEEIELPKFNFHTGKREMSGKFIKVDKDHPIILEGIHGLNPEMTRNIPEKNKYKIYISALTQLNIDAHNRISTTDTRLIRRMVRDYKYRGNDPIRTLELWEGVRRGEEKHIFPYQEKADVMFDSALVYELGVLKKYAIELLRKIGPESVYYSEALKLIKFLDYFASIDEEIAVPPNSILREFIGGADKNIH